MTVIGCVVRIFFLRGLLETGNSSYGTYIASIINALQITIFNYVCIVPYFVSQSATRSIQKWLCFWMTLKTTERRRNISMLWYPRRLCSSLSTRTTLYSTWHSSGGTRTILGLSTTSTCLVDLAEEYIERKRCWRVLQRCSLESDDSTVDDFDELAIQFGYVVLFILEFPLTPVLALISNLVTV